MFLSVIIRIQKILTFILPVAFTDDIDKLLSYWEEQCDKELEATFGQLAAEVPNTTSLKELNPVNKHVNRLSSGPTLP